MRHLYLGGRIAAIVAVIALSLTGATKKHQFSPHEKAFFADAQTVEFVRPGLTITINSAKIASDGTITTVYSITDPNGLPLDSAATSPMGPWRRSMLGTRPGKACSLKRSSTQFRV